MATGTNVLPRDSNNSQNDVIASKRSVITNYLLAQILPSVPRFCINAICNVSTHPFGGVNYEWDLTPGGTPQTATIDPTSSDPTLVTISFASEGHDVDKAGITAGELKISPSYQCNIVENAVGTNTITVTQRLLVGVYVMHNGPEYTYQFNAVDKTITDIYTISSVGGTRSTLQLTGPETTIVDNSQTPVVDPYAEASIAIDDISENIKRNTAGFVATAFRQAIPLAGQTEASV
ncbi:hypothetical protein B0H63DRAFT_558109 [Podospora didyma]|uniref:Uncharacterized protein n=1 Tax=Podospora didyma TaxID=330526 RepID=A0AAE0P0V7_9PEZI|nr:hypothetical protein B0H63DRAFT_558109 [Podospora didyma]